MNRILGARGEQMAADFLKRSGYEILERNFKYDRAEIDLIARKENIVVFCEVKTRKSNTYGGGEDAVDSRKQAQIRKAAEGFLVERELDDCDFRFDVIVVEVRTNSTKIRIIQDAF